MKFTLFIPRALARLRGVLLLLVLGVTAACASHPPSTVTSGQPLDFDGLEDQHGNPFPGLEPTALAVYVDGMEAKKLVRGALQRVNSQCLELGRVVYVADISGMPILISRLVAVPKMRDYPYPIWLDYDGVITAQLPARDDTVTLLWLVDGTLQSIDFVTDAVILQRQLQRACGTTGDTLEF